MKHSLLPSLGAKAKSIFDHVDGITNPRRLKFAENDNVNDAFASFDVWGVISTQFWTTLGGYYFSADSSENLADFLLLFGEGGGYAVLGGLVLSNSFEEGEIVANATTDVDVEVFGLMACADGEDLAVELRNWKTKNNAKFCLRTSIKYLTSWQQNGLGQNDFSDYYSCCFSSTSKFVKKKEDETRLKIVERSVLDMSLSDLNNNSSSGSKNNSSSNNNNNNNNSNRRGKSNSVFDRFSFLGNKTNSEIPVSTNEVRAELRKKNG